MRFSVDLENRTLEFESRRDLVKIMTLAAGLDTQDEDRPAKSAGRSQRRTISANPVATEKDTERFRDVLRLLAKTDEPVEATDVAKEAGYDNSRALGFLSNRFMILLKNAGFLWDEVIAIDRHASHRGRSTWGKGPDFAKACLQFGVSPHKPFPTKIRSTSEHNGTGATPGRAVQTVLARGE